MQEFTTRNISNVRSIRFFIFVLNLVYFNDFRDKMMKYYNDLMGVNEDIISNFTIRLGNFNEIQKTLKNINDILQRAVKLRGND